MNDSCRSHAASSSRSARAWSPTRVAASTPVAIGNWCRQLAALAHEGREVVMVSSGAIVEGMKRLGWSARPDRVHELQAAAAVGQMGLVQMYETKLSRARPAQRAGPADARRPGRSRALSQRALDAADAAGAEGRVPVINENDTVVTDEIKFGDNDTLGALGRQPVEADVLVILTDQAGPLFGDPRQDPDARFIARGRRRRRRARAHGRRRRHRRSAAAA